MKRRLDFVMANTLSREMFGGNRLVVFPQGENLPDALMQNLARELKMSAAYVFPPTNPSHTRDIRIFTPEKELSFAGHPTIGAALVLHDCGLLKDAPTVKSRGDLSIGLTFGEKAGPVPVTITFDNDSPTATIESPRIPKAIDAEFDRQTLAELLSLARDDISTVWAAGCYSAGMPFTFVPVRDTAALSRVQINRAVWAKFFRESPAPKIYAFTLADWEQGREVHARMFPPDMDEVEDPAAAGAAVPLGAFLSSRQSSKDGITSWRIHQGIDMGRPSLIHLEVEKADRKIIAVRVGGTFCVIGFGSMHIPVF